MASFHCSVKILKKSEGRSCVQFSAYMSGSELHNDRLNQDFSHTTKEEVCFNEMIFSDRVPESIRTQEKFWNDVEKVEKSDNAQLSRTWEIALPHELTIEQNIELAREYAQSLVDTDGMPAVQIAIHQKQGNIHAHIMAPMRDIDEKGKWLPKEQRKLKLDENGNKIPVLDENGNQRYRERKGKGREMLWERESVPTKNWNDRQYMTEWRKRCADMQNLALEQYGHEARVSHLSYKARGIDKIPQKHLGYEAYKLKRQGIMTRRAIENEAIGILNTLAPTPEIKLAIRLMEAIINEIRRARDTNEYIRYHINRTITATNRTQTTRTGKQTTRAGKRATADDYREQFARQRNRIVTARNNIQQDSDGFKRAIRQDVEQFTPVVFNHSLDLRNKPKKNQAYIDRLESLGIPFSANNGVLQLTDVGMKAIKSVAKSMSKQQTQQQDERTR